MESNLYRSAMMMVLTMLLLSAVVYFALRAQSTVRQINNKVNEETRLLDEALKNNKNNVGMKTRRQI